MPDLENVFEVWRSKVHLDVIDSPPLVDDEDLVAVSEPRQILHPVQVDL